MLKMNNFVIAALALAIGSRIQPATASLVASLNPAADSFVTSGSPANNYGSAGAIALSAAGLPAGELQSVMRFDTSSAKTSFDTLYGAGQWSIQSVTLRLTNTAPNNAVFNASAAGQFNASWMQNDSWVEGTGTPSAPTTTGITFNNLPSFLSGSDAALGTFALSGASSGSATYALSQPAGFIGDILAGSLLSIRLFAADSTVSGVFNSRNFGTASARPELAITAIPEPGTLSISICAALLLTTRRRSRI